MTDRENAMDGRYLLVACARGEEALHVVIEGPLPDALRRPADGVTAAPIRNILVVLTSGVLLPFLSSTNLAVGRSVTATRELLVASFEAPSEDVYSAEIRVVDGQTEEYLFSHEVAL